MLARVTFSDETARADFEAKWISRTGGEPIDVIVSGVEYLGDNAERARDIANEVLGATVDNGLPLRQGSRGLNRLACHRLVMRTKHEKKVYKDAYDQAAKDHPKGGGLLGASARLLCAQAAGEEAVRMFRATERGSR